MMAVGDTIWKYEAWKERTKNAAVPFHADATPEQTSLSAAELAETRALAERVLSTAGYRERMLAFADEKHNDQAGKVSWIKWYNKNHPTWNIRKDVEKLLDDHERHPRQLCKSGGGAASVSRCGDERRVVMREELMSFIGRRTRYRR
jgi:hypothetical protein